MKGFFAKKPLITTTVLAVLMLVIGFGLGRYTASSRIGSLNVFRENDPEDKFTDPLLLVNAQVPEDTGPLKKSIDSYVATAIKNNKATHISYYFKDLNSGRWVGTNENEQYDPGSLGKVAVLIAYLRQAETNPSLLNERIKVTPDKFTPQNDQYYKPASPVLLGQTYTTQELISKMIIDSDNNALFLLGLTMGVDAIKQEYKEMQLPVDANGNITSITPEEYSRFFRVLYNSTYISHTLSEQTLDLLSKTNFTNGLVAGVPGGTIVSHKFGEKAFIDNQNQRNVELHDCGIVYYTGSPYFICVMTKGTNYPDLETIIKDISSLTWKNVSSITK